MQINPLTYDPMAETHQFLVPPMYSGQLKVGLATTAPVGSKIRSFNASADRLTASFHDPLYVERRIQEFQ